MQALLKFTNFLKDRRYALEDLERFTELVESIKQDDRCGYRMKPLTQADRVTQRCRALIHYTWHCQDYVKRILSEHGVVDADRVVNQYIEASSAIQVISYLANENKHAGIDPKKQKWALEVEPRFGKPFVYGSLQKFPHRMKPTIMIWGESLPEFEFTGAAGVGDQTFQFTDFEWLYSCNIEDKAGKPIGNAWGMCEMAFQTWLKTLADHGVAI
jgi:hypothetical protein